MFESVLQLQSDQVQRTKPLSHRPRVAASLQYCVHRKQSGALWLNAACVHALLHQWAFVHHTPHTLE
jgi:hypothetical protein